MTTTEKAIDLATLKAALLELAKTDKAFWPQFMAEINSDLQPAPKPAAAPKAKKLFKKTVARLDQKLRTKEEIQAYLSRNKATDEQKAYYRENYAMNLDALRELQALFADAPSAETIIELARAHQ